MAYSECTIYYLVIRPDQTSVSELLDVRFNRSKSIAQLKRRIRAEYTPLQDVDVVDFVVKRRATALRALELDIYNPTQIAEEASQAVPLREDRRIADLDVEPNEILFVVSDRRSSGATVYEDEVDRAIDSNDEYNLIFPTVTSWKRFVKDDLLLNNVSQLSDHSPPPGFVSELDNELYRSPSVDQEAEDIYRTIPDSVRAAYFARPPSSTAMPPSASGSSIASSATCRHASKQEVCHVAWIACTPWERIWETGGKLTELMACAIFYSMLFVYLIEDPTITAHLSSEPWALRFIIRGPDKPRHYRPKSSFLISKWNLPRLLIEVSSVSNNPELSEDQIRMLMTGSSVVRFANKFLDAFKANKTFVLVAISIREYGLADYFTLFQNGGDASNTVYYRKAKLKLHTPEDRARFLLRLYNFIDVLRGESDFCRNTEYEVARLATAVVRYTNKHGLDSVQTIMMPRATESSGSVTDASSTVGDVGTVYRAELEAHGYKVEPEDFVDSSGGVWEAIVKRPPHVLSVYRRKNRNERLIAKRMLRSSNELQIYNRLATFSTKSAHIISLYDSFDTWLILPEMKPLTNCLEFEPNKLRPHIVDICWGLIAGLAYLHEHGIAHRDIKPGNLVVDRSFCLKIIDFGLAVQVKDETEEIDDDRGTPGWMAPEVESGTPYSPVKADRWACGKVILYFLAKFNNHDRVLKAKAEELQAHNPDLRPSLLKWREWSSPSLRNSGASHESEASGHKASRPRDDTMGDAGDHLQGAKKRRVGGLDFSETISG